MSYEQRLDREIALAHAAQLAADDYWFDHTEDEFTCWSRP